MQFSKPALFAMVALSLFGCTHTDELNDSVNGQDKKIVLTQAEIDLMLEKARAEERVRVTKELDKQEQQKLVFDEILIRQGKQPKFTEHYQDAENRQKVLHEMSKNQIELEIEQGIRVAQAEGAISKIVPQNRNVSLYQTVDGVNYYRCAANSMKPVEKDGTVLYSSQNRELSATLCKKSRDTKVMTALQNKLFDLGYLQSDVLQKSQLVDGVWGETTLDAVKAYQQDYALLMGQMTIQTLEHIGVFPGNMPKSGFEAVELTKLKQAEKPSDAEIAVASADSTDQTITSVESEVEENDSGEPKQTPLTEEVIAVTSQEPAKVTAGAGNIIHKIIPENRKPAFYKEVGGAKYYRCAANSMLPVKNEKGEWQYSEEHEELSATLCKKSRDQATMTDLQYELYEKGFMPSEGMPVGRLISGEWDKRTLEAVKRYQKANGLLYGQLTIETLESLGIFKPDADRVVKQAAVVEVVKTQETKTATQESVKEEVVAVNSNKQTSKDKEEIPFVPLSVKLADKNFDASSFTPQSTKAEVYATVNGFQLWRCRARSIIPEQVNGEWVYGDNKKYTATLCKKNRSIKLITRLQTALRDQGYLKPVSGQGNVEIDGVWGERTLSAVKGFQKDKGLPYGQLTIETLEKSGVFIFE